MAKKRSVEDLDAELAALEAELAAMEGKKKAPVPKAQSPAPHAQGPAPPAPRPEPAAQRPAPAGPRSQPDVGLWRQENGAWVRVVPGEARAVRRILDEQGNLVREEPASARDISEVREVKAERAVGKLLGRLRRGE